MAPRQRLQVCLVIATVIVAGLLSLIQLPKAEPRAELPVLVVDILEAAEELIDVREEPAPVDDTQPTSVADEHETIESAEHPEDEQREPVDWHAQIVTAAADASLPSSEKPVFNVAQAEQRRRAAEQFAPIPSHEPVPIWDNVIKDMTGRSVLQHGDCQRVINDPNASTREAFETFGQYIVTCSRFKEQPKKLAWVSELESRRAGPSRYGRPLAE